MLKYDTRKPKEMENTPKLVPTKKDTKFLLACNPMFIQFLTARVTVQL